MRADDEGEQGDLELTPASRAVRPDVADRERDPGDGRDEDRDAQRDPCPADHLAGDAGEARGGERATRGSRSGAMTVSDDDPDRDRPEADERDRQPARRLTLDGQGRRDGQHGRRQERGAGDLEPARHLVDCQDRSSGDAR